MKIHKNARLTPKGREILVCRIVNEGLRVEEAAQASGVSVRTAYKWLARYRAQGREGLRDGSSRPVSCPHRTSEEQRAAILALRRARCTYREISRRTGVAHSTVARIAQQAGLNRLSHLDPPVASCRYVYPHPGDLLHLDVKRLGRFVRPGHRVTGNRRKNSAGAGWEYVHVAIDDHSRVSFACIQPGETAHSACSALLDTLRYFPNPRSRLHPRHDRQRLLLPLETLRKTVPTTETAPYPHPTLYPENQRKSRTLHPIRAARMGLRSRLRQLQPARRVPPLLAAPIQLASTTRQLEIPNTHPIPQYPAEQRGGFTQLDSVSQTNKPPTG